MLKVLVNNNINESILWMLIFNKVENFQGEWRIQAANPGPITINGLRCGSAYRAYGSAGGPPGSEIAVRTSGGPPVAPPDIRWIKANATHARFDTSVWSDGGCGPVALKLEWIGSGAAGARDIPVGGEVILGGKSPIAYFQNFPFLETNWQQRYSQSRTIDIG